MFAGKTMKSCINIKISFDCTVVMLGFQCGVYLFYQPSSLFHFSSTLYCSAQQCVSVFWCAYICKCPPSDCYLKYVHICWEGAAFFNTNVPITRLDLREWPTLSCNNSGCGDSQDEKKWPHRHSHTLPLRLPFELSPLLMCVSHQELQTR